MRLTSSIATVVDASGELAVDLTDRTDGLAWSVTNAGDEPVAVRSVRSVHRIDGSVGTVRMLRNGYQSWTPSGLATLGSDVDPSTIAHFEFLQAAHHADQRDAEVGELRSEWFTVLVDESGDAPGATGGEGGASTGPVLVAFDAGTEHDGTFRLRQADDGAIELAIEAFLGGAVLAPGERRELHAVTIAGGDGTPGADLLDAWAARTAAETGARASAPYQVGWCSWYHYFHDVTEQHIRDNLTVAARDGWPFDVFQVDDGYQAAIGDWLATNDKFPSGMAAVAADIAAAGFRPGIWYAPFLAAPDSQVVTDHPDWIARRQGSSGELEPLFAWFNPPWGGGVDGFMYALDTSNPDVLAHIEHVARELVGMGYTYLKLDFTFAPSVEGVWHDPSRTPAQRVRAGYAAVRAGAGDDTFLLGCGVPLANVVGLVDGNRIGQDVAPYWAIDPGEEVVPGYLGVQPSTRFACTNTLVRAFLHRRFWLNDPDCLMLRTDETDLSPEAARTWAQVVALSGGMALVSDDLALLDAGARALLDETVALGRAADAEAIAGRTPRVDDLLDRPAPVTIAAAGHVVVVDDATGAGSFT